MRRTRKDKIKASGYRIRFGGVVPNQIKKNKEEEVEAGYLRSDLTKVGLLTMLALALELLLYWKLKS